MKRVGVDSGYEATVGEVKVRCVASVRSSVGVSADGEVVRIGGVELAMDCRSCRRGSPRALRASAMACVWRVGGRRLRSGVEDHFSSINELVHYIL